MTTSFKATMASLIGYAIFGFSFIFSKLALETAPPFVLMAVRFLVAFLVLNLVLLTGKVKLRLKGKPIGLLLLLGLLQPVLYFIFETYGIRMTTASLSGVIIGLVPVVGLVCGAVFLKEKCTAVQVVCTILSVLGVALTTTGGVGTVSMPGVLLLFGAAISSALFAVLSRKVANQVQPFERTWVMFLLGSIVFSVVALVQNGNDFSVLSVTFSKPTFWLSILYLAAASSVGAFLLINYSLTYISAGRSLIFSNFTTVISVLAGILILGDDFSPLQMVGIVIIILGVFGVSWQKKAK